MTCTGVERRKLCIQYQFDLLGFAQKSFWLLPPPNWDDDEAEIEVGIDWLKAPCILAFDSVSTVAIWRTEEFEIGACTNIFHWEKYTAAFFAVLHPLSIWQIVTRTFLWATSIDWQSKSPLWYILCQEESVPQIEMIWNRVDRRLAIKESKQTIKKSRAI